MRISFDSNTLKCLFKEILPEQSLFELPLFDPDEVDVEVDEEPPPEMFQLQFLLFLSTQPNTIVTQFQM